MKSFSPFFGAFFISLSLSWHYFSYFSAIKLFEVILWFSLILIATYYSLDFVYKKLSKKLKWHPLNFDVPFFVFSLYFFVFFAPTEFMAFMWFILISLLFIVAIHSAFEHHKHANSWRRGNFAIFLFSCFIFILTGFFQYTADQYYLMDTSGGSVNTVLFRTFIVTLFWVFGFVIGLGLHVRLKSWLKFVFLDLWTILFILWVVAWMVNVEVLYFTGFYFSPLVTDHTENGGMDIMFNDVTYMLAALFVALIIFFVYVFRHIKSVYKVLPKKNRYYYSYFIAFLLTLCSIVFYPFQNLPDLLIIRSFHQYFGGEQIYTGGLSPVIQAKLKNFGISYNMGNSLVSHKTLSYNGPNEDLLPERFDDKKPNVLIIFMESLSARLTDIYNPEYEDLTPGVDAMAEDGNTTIFKNYYNSSTPTIYGLYSQLCSFLPPMPMKEIAQTSTDTGNGLLCLPEIMKNKGGYNEVTYLTAIDKTFALTDQVFDNIGIDKIYDWYELSKYIHEAPKAWGYSDHQLFKFVFDLLQEKRKDEPENPWFVMMSTLDLHAPYNMVQDVIKYKDGKNIVLNSLHTMDDAFLQFWDKFSKSDLYDNTVVILTADHAIQPGNAGLEELPSVKKALPYDLVPLMVYVPDNILKKEFDIYSSSLDFAPTILNLFGIRNVRNSFEGHSIFSDRKNYPYIIGMDEFGLYTNIPDKKGGRAVSYGVPSYMQCDSTSSPFVRTLTLCETLSFYNWKQQAWKDGKYFEK